MECVSEKGWQGESWQVVQGRTEDGFDPEEEDEVVVLSHVEAY